MQDFIIEKAKAVCFTGHRVVEKNFNYNSIKKVVENLVKKGYKYFLVGMALGFDTACFSILLELKKDLDIKIIACVPCPEQADNFNENQRILYDKMLSVADQTIVISPKYTSTCMRKRNKFMVDNSSVLVSYVRRERSGSKFTEKYAISNNLTIIKL